MAERLRITLFGRFVASVEGEPPRLVQIPAPRHRALLAYLAMQPSCAETRERLAALLWGDRPDKQARQSLRQCLLTLRRELQGVPSDPLVVDRDTVALDCNVVGVDAREFLALAQSDAVVDLERAADLCAGRFLDGLDLDVEAFDEWVRTERARITAAASSVLETCAARQDQAGNGPQAVRAAERLVALDPLREGGQRLLLRLLARYRGRDAALSHADGVVRLLRIELAAGPEPETAGLIDEIRRGGLTAAVPRPAGRVPAARAAPAMGAPDPAATPYNTTVPEEASGETPEGAAPAGRASRASRPWPWAAAAVAVAATVAVVLALRLAREPLAPRPPGEATATPNQRPSDPSWRSPPVLSNVSAQTPALAAQGISALVVLPFTAEAGDPDKWLADRLTDDLINDLSRVPALRVIARQTSRLYAGRPVDVAAVGAELGVRYVVDGSVQLDEARLRINVALVDATTRLQVWSDRFERDRTDLPAVQDEITRGLARRLQINVVAAEDRRRAPRPDAAEPQVGDLVAKGWAAVIRMVGADRTAGADRYFEEALKRDPDNFSALTGLGAYHVQAVVMFLVSDPERHIARAEQLLNRAIEQNPWGMMPYYYLGTLDKTRGRPHDALKHFVKVLELNPSYAPAYAQVGHVLSRIGRLNEAMEHVRYAIRLSPKDHAVGIWSLFGGQIELELGNDDVALEWLTRAADLSPRNPFLQATLAAAYALTGDAANAAKHAAEVRKLAPWLTTERMMERLVGLSEPGAGPRRLIEGLNKAFTPAG